jgi:hypothetical protein
VHGCGRVEGHVVCEKRLEIVVRVLQFLVGLVVKVYRRGVMKVAPVGRIKGERTQQNRCGPNDKSDEMWIGWEAAEVHLEE